MLQKDISEETQMYDIKGLLHTYQTEMPINDK